MFAWHFGSKDHVDLVLLTHTSIYGFRRRCVVSLNVDLHCNIIKAGSIFFYAQSYYLLIEPIGVYCLFGWLDLLNEVIYDPLLPSSDIKATVFQLAAFVDWE